MGFKEEIAKAVEKALGKKGLLGWIEVPPKPGMGDYAFPCFRLAKELEKAPAEIAEELREKVELPSSIEKAESAGPYLNFFVKKAELADNAIPAVLKQKEKFGNSKIGKGKKVMVEYSGPNTNKPLHVGHLRNDSIGMAVSNILEATGHKVIRANIVNDRGVHICQSMLAYEKWGKGKQPDKKADHFVGDYYVLFNKKLKQDPSLAAGAQLLLRKWENNDKQALLLWKKMNAWALDGFKETYKEFGSRFDEWFKESEYYNKAKPLLEKGLEAGIFFENEEGALVANLEHHNLPNKIVLRPDGSSIYITNDLALTKYKFEHFRLNEAVWVVASEQNLYFRQLFKIFELLGFKWSENCRHLSYGLVFLPHGKMKSREGTVIDADDLIADMKAMALKAIKQRYPKLGEKEKEKRAKAIALAAIKFYMLKTDEVKDLHFNPEESLSFEGETGPYLQYTYARAKSILRKAGKRNGKPDFSLLQEEEEKQLSTLLYNYPGIVEKAAESLQPHILCQALTDLASSFNSFYHSVPVIKAEDEKLAAARLALVKAVAIALGNGLKMLNIEAIEKM